MVAMLYGFSGGGGGGGGTASLPDISPFRGQVTSVPPQAETTVVSRVIPGGFAFKLRGIVATGSSNAEWILYDNGTEVYRTRTSESDRAVELLHGNAIAFAAGHTCSLKAVHTESTTQNFYGTLLGNDE